MREELQARYDSRKSFYGKAMVEETTCRKHNQSRREVRLYSYGTLVAAIVEGKPVIYGFYSQTTTRHIKEFLKQNGFKAISKAQMARDYEVE